MVGRDRLHNLPGTFQVVRCRCCGLLRTNPRPTLETIGYYYPESYGPFHATRVDSSTPPSPSRVKRALRPLFRFGAEELPPQPPGRMLEIGCASGRFLYTMAQQGWQVEGIEPSAQAAEAARALGYPVFTGAVEHAPNPPQPYDLVAGWMVLEHLHEPVAALRKIAGWVRPGGWIALSVPNAAALEFRVFGAAWFALQLPTHLYHYTPGTLRNVLEAGGWQLERVMHQRIIGNLVASLGHALADLGFSARPAQALQHFPQSDYGAYLAYPVATVLSLLGQTGRMTVWARRK
jgi:2-polyprenyl-3-methyl-5-hydroxy-6-metoxy-1,4-benzoquinol methylase